MKKPCVSFFLRALHRSPKTLGLQRRVSWILIGFPTVGRTWEAASKTPKSMRTPPARGLAKTPPEDFSQSASAPMPLTELVNRIVISYTHRHTGDPNQTRNRDPSKLNARKHQRLYVATLPQVRPHRSRNVSWQTKREASRLIGCRARS